MRISNLHHETAIQSLMLVQEIEPETWERLQNRIDGANTIKHIKKDAFQCPKELPEMFESWEEYALYLADNIIQDEDHKKLLFKTIEKKKVIYDGDNIIREFYREVIHTILSSDWDLTKMTNFEMRPHVYAYRQYKKGKLNPKSLKYTKAFTAEE